MRKSKTGFQGQGIGNENAKGHSVFWGVMKVILYLDCGSFYNYASVKTHQTIHLKWVSFLLYGNYASIRLIYKIGLKTFY